MKLFWKVLIGIGALLSVLGAFYSLDKNYVRLSYHDVCFAQVRKDMTGMQEQYTRQRIYDEVFFWQKMEIELTQAIAAHPNDENLKRKLQDVRKKKEDAERRLPK